jgi:hypothetical protein
VRVRVLSPALDEISAAAIWFDSQRAGLGSEFWHSVDEMLVQIGENPLRFAKSEFASPAADIRTAILRRFQYVVHFAVGSDDVQILSVAHSARRPGYWIKRSK